jgi:hypothetical protein
MFRRLTSCQIDNGALERAHVANDGAGTEATQMLPDPAWLPPTKPIARIPTATVAHDNSGAELLSAAVQKKTAAVPF